jgi:hypothetical protein
MLEFLIFLLAVGFLTYYFFRHPIKSLKVAGAGLGLILLGILTLAALVVLVVLLLG